MKPLIIIAFVAAIATSGRTTDGPPGSAREKLLVKIIQAAPPMPAKKPADPDLVSDKDVVVMDRYTVAERDRSRDLAVAVEVEKQKIDAQRYSITEGGAVLKKDIGRARLEIGTWGAGSGLNFLRISW